MRTQSVRAEVSLSLANYSLDFLPFSTAISLESCTLDSPFPSPINYGAGREREGERGGRRNSREKVLVVAVSLFCISLSLGSAPFQLMKNGSRLSHSTIVKSSLDGGSLPSCLPSPLLSEMRDLTFLSPLSVPFVWTSRLARVLTIPLAAALALSPL